MDKKYPVVKVIWTDACGGDGWVTLKDLLDEVLVTHRSVGYLIEHNDTNLKMTMSYESDEKNLGAYLVIPNINIIDIHYYE